jgi:hypothetical protein
LRELDFLCVEEGLDKVLCELERTRLVTSGCYSLGILVTVRIWLKPLRCFGENLAETASVLLELLEAGMCLRLCPDVIYCV